jgi:hypothetical protein
MKVLKADPFTLESCLLDCFDSSLVGTTAHSDLMESISADGGFSKLLQFRTGVRSRRDDEEHGVGASSLAGVQVLERERCRLDVLVAESLFNEQGHSGLKSIRSEHLD